MSPHPSDAVNGFAKAGLAAAVSLSLAACSSGEEPASDRSASGTAGGVSAVGGQAMVDAQVGMARCMRKQGIDFPDPRSGGRLEFDPASAGISETRLNAAEKRCDRYRRAIAEAAPKRSEAELGRARDATLGFARCMRKQGQDVPDPGAGGTAVSVPADAKQDPAFSRASRKCEGILREAGGP